MARQARPGGLDHPSAAFPAHFVTQAEDAVKRPREIPNPARVLTWKLGLPNAQG